MDKEKNITLKNIMIDTTIDGWQNILSGKIISDLFPFSIITSEKRFLGKTSTLVNLAATMFPMLSPNEITVIMTKDKKSLEEFKKKLVERIESVVFTTSAEKFFPRKYRFVTQGENFRGSCVKNVIIDDADLMDEKALYDLIINLPINAKGKIILSGASSKKGKSIWNFIVNNPTYITYELVQKIKEEIPEGKKDFLRENVSKNEDFEDICQKILNDLLKEQEEKKRMKESEVKFYLKHPNEAVIKNARECDNFAKIINNLLTPWFFLR